ncbi:MAG: response regulator transcription factor [Spirochaetia bacterium]|nr:response regulator transcription factor [Spirochaetia bacterium]
MIRIVIADDHHLIRRGFRQYIDRIEDMEYVAEAETAGELLSICESVTCDIIILDIGLPDRNGLEVLNDIKNSHPTIGVLILSMHSEERFAKRALENGASGYLTKGSSPEDLERAIRKAFSGGKYISDTLAEELASEVGKTHPDLPHHRLSHREFQVLLHLADGERVSDIAEALHVGVSTVHTYKQRIMEKLGLNTIGELIHYAYRYKLFDS